MRLKPFLFLLALYAATYPAFANTGFLGLSLGNYNTFRSSQRELDLRLEYRGASPIFLGKIKPFAGLELTSHGTIWAGSGLYADINLGKNIIFTPSFGAGLYAKGNSATDLDYPIQFRSQIELSYVFSNMTKLGLSLSHISNASLGDHNPGAEILGVYYTIPLNIFNKDNL